MNAIEVVLQRIYSYGDRSAIYWNGKEFSYDEFVGLLDGWSEKLTDLEIHSGTVCAVMGEFSPQTCALFFALMKRGAIIVPFTKSIKHEIEVFKEIAGVEIYIEFNEDDTFTVLKEIPGEINPLIRDFREKHTPGLVVFSSGSTGRPKGILHDCERVMRKFTAEREGWRSVLFLLMDHFGGFNTFLGAFAYGGMAVCVNNRQPAEICKAIESSGATLLPTTPTFINLLIASRVYHSFNLSSIRLITYGTEVMPEETLKKVASIFPNAVLKQTYGLSEVGVLRSKSENDVSLWVKIGGNGFEVKVADGLLWVRSEANMVGYLNAPSPFDEDGWMCTGDEVEVNGEYMRILGRKSEMINVGGQKVFPAEVETVLLEDANVKEATVFGVKHQLMGHVVHANISLYTDEPVAEFTGRMRLHCSSKLAKYKIPVKFSIVNNEDQRSDRFKKIRIGLDK